MRRQQARSKPAQDRPQNSDFLDFNQVICAGLCAGGRSESSASFASANESLPSGISGRSGSPSAPCSPATIKAELRGPHEVGGCGAETESTRALASLPLDGIPQLPLTLKGEGREQQFHTAVFTPSSVPPLWAYTLGGTAMEAAPKRNPIETFESNALETYWGIIQGMRRPHIAHSFQLSRRCFRLSPTML